MNKVTNMNGALETLFFAAFNTVSSSFDDESVQTPRRLRANARDLNGPDSNSAHLTDQNCYESDTIHAEKCSMIFINAMYHNALESFSKAGVYVQQHFRPYAKELECGGFDVRVSCEDVKAGVYDLALVMVPKNMIEARYVIAQGIQALREGGTLICAADNKAGGGRLKKLLQDFGFETPELYSRNKARAARVRKEGSVNEAAVAQALEAGAMQSVLGGEFVSQPGIFGWDKIDKGSEILAAHLPSGLKGRVADFGCGYGYLARAVLGQNPGINTLYCVDADMRALKAGDQNLKGLAQDVKFFWLDLTEPASAPENLDMIVMNPPFHEGKKADADIGMAFIARAYESLHKGGHLWMVANRQLAYEAELSKRFASVRKVYEGQGFKVFEAVK